MQFDIIDPEIPEQAQRLGATERALYARLYDMIENDPHAMMVLFVRDEDYNSAAIVVCENVVPDSDAVFVRDEDADITPDTVAWAIECSHDAIPSEGEEFGEWLESVTPFEYDTATDTEASYNYDLAQFVSSTIGAVLLDNGNEPVDPDWVVDWQDGEGEDDELEADDDDSIEYDDDDDDDYYDEDPEEDLEDDEDDEDDDAASA